MLELSGLRKSYGAVRALVDVSLTAQRGRMLGFLGPNGAGKTTSMRAIFGLLRLDEGTVHWDGHAVGKAERLRFGYMPEQRGLYPRMRIAEQLSYLGELHGQSKAAARASAADWLDKLGLADRRNDRLEALSHGNQQRVQLAAALVHSPELVVLDEPFSGLDPLGVETMSALLRESTRRGAAVLFSSHQLDLVEDLCDDVAIVNAGRIVLVGEVRSLKDASPVRILEVETEAAGRLPAGLVQFEAESHGNWHKLIVGAETDVSSLLASLAADGGIRQMSYATPSLTHLFREAVK